MSLAVRQLITRLRSVEPDENSAFETELNRINNLIYANTSDLRTLKACICELIYLRHQGYPLKNEYISTCKKLQASDDKSIQEIGVLGSEILSGVKMNTDRIDGIKGGCIELLKGSWVLAKKREDDVVQWLEWNDDWLLLMYVVRVLNWLRIEDKWNRSQMIENWIEKYQDGENCLGLLCELIRDATNTIRMIQFCMKRSDSNGRRWFLKHLIKLEYNANDLRRIDWKMLLKTGDVDLVFGVLLHVKSWTEDEGIELISVLLHCATLGEKRRLVWDVILKILETSSNEKILMKVLVVLARTGGDVGSVRIEKLAKVVCQYRETKYVLNKLLSTGSCEAFVRLYVIVFRKWGSNDYVLALKRYSSCTIYTKLMMIDWFNKGGFELEEELHNPNIMIRQRVREALVTRHTALALPPIEEYIRMLKFDVGVFQMCDEKVKFKIKRLKDSCELDLKWSKELDSEFKIFGDSYSTETLKTPTSLTITFTINKLYPEFEEPIFVLNGEDRRIPLGLKTLKAQGMPLPVFDHRWNVLPHSSSVAGVSLRTIERMGAAVEGSTWCGLIYTNTGVIGVLGKDDAIKCTKDADLIVARLKRCV